MPHKARAITRSSLGIHWTCATWFHTASYRLQMSHFGFEIQRSRETQFWQPRWASRLTTAPASRPGESHLLAPQLRHRWTFFQVGTQHVVTTERCCCSRCLGSRPVPGTGLTAYASSPMLRNAARRLGAVARAMEASGGQPLMPNAAAGPSIRGKYMPAAAAMPQLILLPACTPGDENNILESSFLLVGSRQDPAPSDGFRAHIHSCPVAANPKSHSTHPPQPAEGADLPVAQDRRSKTYVYEF